MFSYLFSTTRTFCFVIFMVKQVMVDLDSTLMSCVTKVQCAKECLNRNCIAFGFNKTSNQYFIPFGEYTVADNETILWSKRNSKPQIPDDVAKADVQLRTAFFQKAIYKSSDGSNYPFDCSDVYGDIAAGKVYTIYPEPSYPCDVQCMIVGNEKWTKIQGRQDGSQDFYLNWAEYKHGFGNRHLEYWIGNEALHLLTSKVSYQLLIQLEDFENETRFALYDTFAVADESSLYKITVSGYSGNAGDSMYFQNEQAFTTKDKDNDIHGDYNCAKEYHGAWWYKFCHRSNLNGLYLSGDHPSFADGINWYTWRGYHYSYKVCRMLIRRK